MSQDSLKADIYRTVSTLTRNESPWYGFLTAGLVGLLIALVGEHTPVIDGTLLKQNGLTFSFAVSGGYFAEGVVYRLYLYGKGGEVDEYPGVVQVVGTIALVAASFYGFNPGLTHARDLIGLIGMLWLVTSAYIWYSQMESSSFAWFVQLVMAVALGGLSVLFLYDVSSDLDPFFLLISFIVTFHVGVFVVGLYYQNKS